MLAKAYEDGRRGLPVGAHRRGVLRRVGRRPGRGPRGASTLPVLRKDFTVSSADVCDARLDGRRRRPADRGRPRRRRAAPASARLAGELGLDALVEVHDEAELDRALAAGRRPGRRQPARPAPSRSTATGPRGWPTRMPDGVVKVAESGIRDADDAAALRRRRLRRRPGRRVARHRPATRPPPCGSCVRCSSRSAASPARRTRSSPWPWAPTPSGSSSPRRPARSRPAGAPTSSSACRPRSSPSACSATRRPSGWSRSCNRAGLKARAAPRPRDGRAGPVGARAGAVVIKAFAGRRSRASPTAVELRRRRHHARRAVAGLGPGLRLAAGRRRARRAAADRWPAASTPDNVAEAIAAVQPVGRRRRAPASRRRRAARTRASCGPSSPRPRRRRRRRTTSDATPTAGRYDWRRTDRAAMTVVDGRARRRRAVRRVRRPVRARVAGAGLPGARGGLPRRRGPTRRSAPSTTASCATTAGRPTPVTECQRPVRAARRARAAQARGPHPHRLAQDQQRDRPGPAHPAHGQAADHRRDRRRPARRGHRHRGRAVRPRVRRLHGRGRRRAPGPQRVPHGAARRRGAAGRVGQPHAEGRHQRGHARLGGHRSRRRTTASAR